MKLIAIGDSITYGFPYSPSASWLDIAAQHCGIDYENCGINGDTTGQMLQRFSREVCRLQPSHVIIMGGTNDVFEALCGKEIVEHTVQMTVLARTNGIVPVLGLPIPCNEPEAERRLREYRTALREYAQEQFIDLLDFFAVMSGVDGLGIKPGLYCDGVHPNEAGYKVMAAAAIDFIETRLLCIKPASI